MYIYVLSRVEELLYIQSFHIQEQEGATLVVSAKFNVVSVRNIYLQFEEVSFSALHET